MVRQFLVKVDDKEMRLWYETLELCRAIWGDAEISEIEDFSYLKTVNNIKSKAIKVPESDCFEIEINGIVIVFKFLEEDKQILPAVKYMEFDDSKKTVPILKTIENIETFYNKFFNNDGVTYSVISERKYGQPKLAKPKELTGINPFAAVQFFKASCPLYRKGNDLYIKHRDYFSKEWRPPIEDVGAPLDYILKKYFNQNKSNKFIYSDAWGSVVLRNEAYIKISNIFHYAGFLDAKSIANILKKLFCGYYKLNFCDEEISEWRFFFERVANAVSKTRGGFTVEKNKANPSQKG